MSNADLIARLRKHACYTAFPKPISEAADALELADKRIAELEADYSAMSHLAASYLGSKRKAERKLAVAREALQKISMFQCGTPVLTYQGMEIMAREALAQIGGDE